MPKVPIITFDGPSGSGKGTIAQRLANQLGWHYLDSGALYRALAIASIQQSLVPEENAVLLSALRELEIQFLVTSTGCALRLNGQDCTALLRTETVGARASQLAAMPSVRQLLLDKQRQFSQAPGLVTDGRDMGSVVFQEAVLKFYLTASVEERARRRHLQLQEMGNDATFGAVLQQLAERDARDQNRETAPLVEPEGSVMVNTDHKTIEEVYEFVLDTLRQQALLS